MVKREIQFFDLNGKYLTSYQESSDVPRIGEEVTITLSMLGEHALYSPEVLTSKVTKIHRFYPKNLILIYLDWANPKF